MKFITKFIKSLVESTGFTLPKGKCWNCHDAIFNVDSHFGELGLCIGCYTAYRQGIDSIKNRFPEQIEIECQNCKNITIMRDRLINLHKANKTALCCNHPDYLYYIEETEK